MPIEGEPVTSERLPTAEEVATQLMSEADRTVAGLRKRLAEEQDKTAALLKRIDGLQSDVVAGEEEIHRLRQQIERAAGESQVQRDELVRSSQLLAAQVDACRKAASKIVPAKAMLGRLHDDIRGVNPTRGKGAHYPAKLLKEDVKPLADLIEGVDDLPAAVGWQ